MPTPRQMRKFVNRMVNQKIEKHPSTAVIAEVDGNLADIRVGGQTTYYRNCRIVGDPSQLFTNLTVSIRWEDYNGTTRPVVLAPGGGGISGQNRSVVSTVTGTSIDVDNITIENTSSGIGVKKGGITLEHLDFIPAMYDHQHAIGEIIPGWSVSPDGMLFTSQVSIVPDGTITFGRSPDIVKLSVEDNTYRIWAGHGMPMYAPFSVSKTGHLISSSATIAGWTINTSEIKKTGIILDSNADAIYVGAAGDITLDGGTSKILVGSSGQITLDGINQKMTVGVSGDQIVIDGANKYIKNTAYTEGDEGFIINADGYAEFGHVRVRGSISSSVFEYGDIQATAGTLFVSKSAGKIHSDWTSPSSIGNSAGIQISNDNSDNELFQVITGRIATISINSGGSGYAVGDILTIVKSGGSGGQVEVAHVSGGVITEILMHNRGQNYTTGSATSSGGSGSSATFTINTIKTEGDILWIKTLTPTGVAEAWVEIAGVSVQTGYTIYTPAYLRGGDTSTLFRAGTGVASIGIHNTGMIYLSADEVVGSSANISFVEWYRNAVSTMSVVVGGSNYTVGDILRIQDASSFIPCRVIVTSVSGSAVTGVSIYSGQIGSDYTTGVKSTHAEKYAYGTLPTGCTINITAVMNPWDGSQTTFGRLGNIAGAYGAGSEDKYGFGFGNYASGNYISYNAEQDDNFIISAADGSINISPDGIRMEGTVNNDASRIAWYSGSQMIFRINSYENSDYYRAYTKMEAWAQSGWHPTIEIEATGLSGTIPSISLITGGGAGNALAQVFGQSGIGNFYVESDVATIYSTDINLQGDVYGSSGIKVTGALSSPTGTGIEITSNTIRSYARPSTYQALYLDGSATYFRENGSTILTIDGGDIYTTTPADIWSSCAYTGWSSYSVRMVYRRIIGKQCFIWFHVNGTGDTSGVCSIQLPNQAKNITNLYNQFTYRYTNGGVSGEGVGSLAPGGYIVYLYTGGLGGWANSTTKTVIGQFTYSLA